MPRLARVCPECSWREFGDPEARCSSHGLGVTERNRPYMGVDVPQDPSFRPDVWERWVQNKAKELA